MGNPAYAQETTGEDDPATLQSEVEAESGENATTDEAIVVTGSRIRRPNLESAIPISSLGGEEFFETGEIAVGEELNDLPQLRSSMGQQNAAGQSLALAGLNLLDLRGLGTARTLVLVNGRRHVGSDIINNAVSPDVNTFPTALIQRVDIVTGGNSAIYGSDAIAGVVNFVLKRDFEGVEARGQAGISHYGDAGAYFASLTAGQNFGDGRGNVAISAEYARQDQYFGAGRPFIESQDGFLVVDTDIRCTGSNAATCDPNVNATNSDGNPDRIFFRNIRSGTISNTGVIQFGSTQAAGLSAANNCGTDAVGGRFNCPFIFQQDGTLVPISGARVGIGPAGSFIGGNGEDFRGGEEFQLAANLDRYVVNLLGHYTFSDAFELFGEAKYARTDSIGAAGTGPGFIVSAGLGGDARQAFRIDNPFLTDQARGVVIQQLNRFGVDLNTGAPLTTAQRAQIAAGTFRVRFQESFLNLGKRETQIKRETYRAVVGARGTFNDDWTFEASANYGEFKEFNFQAGALGRQRLLLALDAGRDPATGQIRCRSQFDPAARVGSPTATGTAAQIAATLNADVAACVPINPFGGQFTQQQRDYLLFPSTAEGKITQFVANAFISGDSSEQFELPGGPVGFAMGLEWRREKNFFEVDENTRRNLTFFNPTSTFRAPALDVKEVFGEIRAPLLKDVPFFHELTLNAAARYALYSGAADATGGVLAYNAGVEWAPVRDLRLRGNYSRAVRSPNLSELFTAETAGFATIGANDPCAVRNRSAGASTRAANCAALGVPDSFDFVYPGSLTIRFGGNPNLRAETSKSLTLGGVLQPRILPGFSLSVDYFDIKVEDVITSVGSLTILQQCVDQPTIDNPFCALFQRNRGPGLGPAGEIPGRVLEGSLLQSTLNFASRRARGVDAELTLRRDIPGLGRLDLRGIYTHTFERSNFENPANPKFENVLLKELGDPADEFAIRANLKTGPVTFGYNLRFIGKQYLNTFEDYNSVNDLPPQNADYANVKYYPEVAYHNFRVGFEVGDANEFYVGVDNAFNKEPPLGLTGIGAGSGIYDNRGRFYYSGFKARF
ncbi:MAG: TonB-dependent receptor [Sphingosinicella sp.]|nr:TonB-dependent receptor [Sphingosinicella sp.]